MLLPLVIFVASVAYLPGVTSATTVGRWAVLACGAVLLMRATRRASLGPAHAWGAALLAWGALTALWSASPVDSAGELWHWLILAMLFLAASRSREQNGVLVALVAGLAISWLFAFDQLLGHEPVLATDVPAGLFLSRNALGEVAACALVWAIARRAWSLVPAPLLLVAMSGSRGALLATAIGLGAMLWQRGCRWSVVFPGLLAVAGAAAITWHRDPTLESVLTRFDIWQFALVNLTAAGYGLGTFATLAPGFEYVHNEPLQLAFEIGLGSLLAVPLALRALRSGSPESAALAAILGASLVSFPLHHPMGAALVAVLAGLACGARDRVDCGERLLGDCGSVRSEYEWQDTAGDLPEPPRRRVVVAFRQKHPLGSRELEAVVQQTREGARS